MKILLLASVLAACASPAFAQTTITIAIYPTTAADPNVATPSAAPVTYPMSGAACGQTKAPTPSNPINPTLASFDDPADATKDCVLNIATQIAALASGNYKASAKFDADTYPTVFSNPFVRARVGNLRVH